MKCLISEGFASARAEIDGAKYVADQAWAYWLFDEIAIIQPHDAGVAVEEFQVWKLAVNADQSAVLTCDDGNGTPEGTKALRSYLEYTRSGVLDVATETGHEPDSDFEIAVIEVLRRMNYEVTPQLGMSGFRIDIAVKHPDHLGSYLAAIECDGAQYHSAQSARDRDRIRQEILESQGWRNRIWRIWSTDWFRAPYQEIGKLRDFLENIRKTWTPEHAASDSWVEEGSPLGTAPPPPDVEQTNRLMIDQRLLFGEADKEVRVGDTVEYADTARGDEIKTVRITQRTTALEQGFIAERTPLAQALLGAVVADEVALNIPGVAKRMLRIVAIKRDDS